MITQPVNTERVLIVDENRAILVVERELTGKIDEQRGDLSRPEYLNSLIERQVTGDSQPAYLHRDEFLKVISAMKNLLRCQLEFAASCSIQPASFGEDNPISELGRKLESLAPDMPETDQTPQ